MVNSCWTPTLSSRLFNDDPAVARAIWYNSPRVLVSVVVLGELYYGAQKSCAARENLRQDQRFLTRRCSARQRCWHGLRIRRDQERIATQGTSDSGERSLDCRNGQTARSHTRFPRPPFRGSGQPALGAMVGQDDRPAQPSHRDQANPRGKRASRRRRHGRRRIPRCSRHDHRLRIKDSFRRRAYAGRMHVCPPMPYARQRLRIGCVRGRPLTRQSTKFARFGIAFPSSSGTTRRSFASTT